ncbi:9527_t:CDS:2 [Scutellospora calospora]|uniref:9527_t:CDS:1 n=1 Tax=Scutellospora calospora TaxID=85575 RepID=A0ACA9K8M7_9GLOM|nr:9527_t:CDS:2 [Scutellospora calospora]
MTAVLRSIKYLDFTVPDEYNTYVYFKKVEARFWQLKHYLSFRLKNDEIILPLSTVYNDWQTSLQLISQNSIKKISSSITSLCKDFLDICETFEGSFIKQNCNEEILPNISNEKRTMEDNEETLPNEKRIRHDFQEHEEVFKHEDEVLMNFLNEESETEEEICQPEAEQMESTAFDIPIFFGILDLSGEDKEVKKLFTDNEWSEMKSDFNKTVEFKDIDEKDELYNLFDKIEQAIEKKSDDLITEIDKCTIEREIQSLASAVITNSTKNLTDLLI